MGKELNVILDQQTHHLVLQNKYASLRVIGFVYVGGGLPQRTLNLLRGYNPLPNSRGCLRYVFLSGWQVLLNLAKAQINTDGTVDGSFPPKRDYPRVETMSFQYPDSYLMIPSSSEDLFNVHMWFRTYIADSILAIQTGSAGVVRVSLLNGKVVLDVSLLGVSRLPSLIQGESLNDGEWHHLSIAITKTEMKLKLDHLQQLWYENHALNVTSFGNYLYIANFVGCIRGLHVDGKLFELGSPTSNYHAVEKVGNGCNISSRCFPNPCRHGGKCSDLLSGGFSCDCQKTFYRGPLCEQRIYLRTCQEYKNLGLSDDAHCKVDPDAEGPNDPFEVLCKMTDQNHAITLIHHDKMAPQVVSSVQYNKYWRYRHQLKYSVDLEDIEALISRSERCRQFVSFNCFGSKLLQAPTGPAEVNWRGGDRWEMYQVVRNYWPGAPAGSMKCACGLNGTCADPRFACNCDIGDETWREDKGKPHLFPRVYLLSLCCFIIR